MNQSNKVFRTYSLWFLDMFCIVVSFLLATFIRYGQNNDMMSKTYHYLILAVFLMAASVYSFFFDWNHDYLKRGYYRELAEILKFNAFITIIVVVFIFMTRMYIFVSRTVIMWFVLINIAMMLVAHLVFKRILRKALSTDTLVSKVLVIAQLDQIESTVQRLLASSDNGLQVIRAVCADTGQYAGTKSGEICGVPVYAGIKDLIEVMTTVPFDEVFINTPDYSQKHLREIISGFEEMGVDVHYNLELPDMGSTTSKVEVIGDYTVISYTRFRYSNKRLLFKRLIDIVGGFVGLAITGILTIFIAPAIKMDSPGPVFFSQVRVGKNGRRFRIYKFRSMRQDAEAQLGKLEKNNEMNGLMFKMDDDPRVTRVGRFLRKTSLDEFPQFLNVIKGDMSLVGTRPPTEKEFEQYNEHYRRRIAMTPGLTGLWQVSGRSEITDFDEVVKLDLQYIDNWSLGLDFKIILQTIGVVFKGKGAM